VEDKNIDIHEGHAYFITVKVIIITVLLLLLLLLLYKDDIN